MKNGFAAKVSPKLGAFPFSRLSKYNELRG